MSEDRHIKTDGIVLRETPLGENGKLLVFFTRQHGRLTAAAKGVKKAGSSMVQIAQLFAYSDLELYRGSSSLYTLTGGTLIEPFFGLGSDYDRILEASNMSSLLLKVIQEELPDEDTMRLLLNALYMISSGKRRPDLTRLIFSLRLLMYQGIAPDTAEITRMWGRSLSKGTEGALEHIFYADMKDLFSFGVSDDVMSELEGISSMLLHDI